MKTEKLIRAKIEKVTADFKHVLDAYPATTTVNSPRALMQQQACSLLDGLYWTLGELRPKFNCDEWSKVNH